MTQPHFAVPDDVSRLLHDEHKASVLYDNAKRVPHPGCSGAAENGPAELDIADIKATPFSLQSGLLQCKYQGQMDSIFVESGFFASPLINMVAQWPIARLIVPCNPLGVVILICKECQSFTSKWAKRDESIAGRTVAFSTVAQIVV